MQAWDPGFNSGLADGPLVPSVGGALCSVASSVESEVGRQAIQWFTPAALWAQANGYTPLHLAAAEGKTEAALALMAAGASATAPAESKRTPLHLAAQSGNVETIRVLVGGAAAAASFVRLQWLCAAAMFSVHLQWLCAAAGSVLAACSAGSPCLWQMLLDPLARPGPAERSWKEQAMRPVLPSKARLEVGGLGAGLHAVPPCAASKLLVPAAVLLAAAAAPVPPQVAAGGQPDAKDADGITALHIATVNYDLEAIRELLLVRLCCAALLHHVGLWCAAALLQRAAHPGRVLRWAWAAAGRKREDRGQPPPSHACFGSREDGVRGQPLASSPAAGRRQPLPHGQSKEHAPVSLPPGLFKGTCG